MSEITTTQDTKPLMLTVRQAAATGVLPERTLRRLIATKKIPVFRSGKTQYLNYSMLLEALNDPSSAIWK